MKHQVVVLSDELGQPSTLFTCRFARVYAKQQGVWQIEADIPVEVDMEKGLKQVREQTVQLIEGLAGAKIIVGSQMSGVANNLFQQAGFHIFEASEAPELFLDEVLEAVEAAEAAVATPEPTYAPQAINEAGDYLADLSELQLKRPGMTSKQALLPFLRTGGFRSLQVNCAHVPKWFEQMLPGLGYEFETLELGLNHFQVKVYPKQQG